MALIAALLAIFRLPSHVVLSEEHPKCLSDSWSMADFNQVVLDSPVSDWLLVNGSDESFITEPEDSVVGVVSAEAKVEDVADDSSATVRLPRLSSTDRARLWRQSTDKVGGGLSFIESVGRKAEVPEEYSRVISVDLPRSGPGITYCGKTDLLENVLMAYAVRNEEVRYCQGMHAIAAEFLIVGLSEEESFKGLAFMVEEVAYDYFINGMPGFFNDMQIIGKLIKIRYPELVTKLESLDDVPQEGVIISLNEKNGLSLFTVSLPPAALLRVWDVVMIYGRQGLIAAELAMVGMLFGECLKGTLNSDEMPEYIHAFKKKVSAFENDRIDDLINEIAAILAIPDLKRIPRFRNQSIPIEE